MTQGARLQGKGGPASGGVGDLGAAARTGAARDDVIADFAPNHALERPGPSAEAAEAIVYPACNDGAHITDPDRTLGSGYLA